MLFLPLLKGLLGISTLFLVDGGVLKPMQVLIQLSLFANSIGLSSGQHVL